MAPPAGELDESFVNIWMDKERDGHPSTEMNKKSDFYGQWTDQASAKHSNPSHFGADALRQLYPKHSIVMTTDFRLNPLSFPGVQSTPMESTPMITNLLFIPLARKLGSVPGILIDLVEFGAFRLAWDKYDFILFMVKFPSGFGSLTQSYILHEGPEDATRSLILTVGNWADQLHDEIWVFNQGFWQKDHALWTEVQKADWADVILKDEFKKTLQKDVYGFFASEEIYKELAIPWKRGLIMYGPPGNGKTISLKVIMKTCGADGFAPLYVKSFQSYKGEEGAMADVFDKARQLSPCVVILEDLDSLINDRNRSFFLNQLDGLEGNDGLLVIGTTNHFDRLDPGLSTRPSRFDRKFNFDDPDREARVLYAKYWQRKLQANKEITFPDQLIEEIADLTKQFSFAYLKEAFVSTLVTLASYEGNDKPLFATVLKDQIKALRKQLDKSSYKDSPYDAPESFDRSSRYHHGMRTQLDTLSDPALNRTFKTYSRSQDDDSSDRSVRMLLDTLSESLARSDIGSLRAYGVQQPMAQASDRRDYRALLDRLASQRDINALADRLHIPAPTSNTRGQTFYRDLGVDSVGRGAYGADLV